MGSHIESWVPDPNSLISNRNSRSLAGIDGSVLVDNGTADLCQLFTLALLDLDSASVLRLEVDAGCWRSDNKLDTVVTSQHSQLIGTNLVGSISVADNAVSADNDGANVHALTVEVEESTSHAVGDQGGGDALEDELEGSKTTALVVRTSLGAVGVLEETLGVKSADDAKGSAVARGCEGTGVAVREDGDGLFRRGIVLLLQPGGTMRADRGVVVEVLGENLLGRLDVGVQDGLLGLRVRQTLEVGGSSGQLEKCYGVGEINSRWPALLEVVKSLFDMRNDLFRLSGSW